MQMVSNGSDCDVLVVGGGPAGSTAAALLVEMGHRVVLLEKDRHPRFHIGESLLPCNLPLLQRLGVLEQVERIGMLKYGAEFVSPYHGKAVTFDFANAWDKSKPYAYQVRRSEFDHILIRNAAAKGATVIEGCKVTDVAIGGDGTLVTASQDDGTTRTVRARFLVDASGRDTLLASRFGIKRRNAKHNSAAMFGHFTGAKRLPGKAEGNITVFWFDHGWFWFIPLADGTTSVGAVCWPYYFKTRKTDQTRFFLDTIALCPALAERLEGAELTGPVTGTGNFSYQADRMSGPGYVMLGDAFAFIDPVFSTGVYLAMTSAFEGAKAVDACLREPHRQDEVLKQFEKTVRQGIGTFSWYIYRVTTPALRNLFMGPRNVFRVEEALLSLLAGDVFRPSPIKSRLKIFKAIYYMNALLDLKRNYVAWRKRRRNIRAPVGDVV
ncbi:NAD(P)/FAD-dependent oxidoreductase [Azospirillum picis]|uniref:Flavin-dependent dehydrogenase n=1 Tax=Azospirillum picis TaxID=488438 RepID=A0ABU0MQR3_9PROT|nr:NAD(P)/FAD-dependent oxidoreductase [Azospirillum picis]MBP2302040.1 flavin-dependent dehydrogenase [Azospirillum picis]MDQ0535669.1 flavin-dependent dehydrogenase [Azospirillum picis]